MTIFFFFYTRKFERCLQYVKFSIQSINLGENFICVPEKLKTIHQ